MSQKEKNQAIGIDYAKKSLSLVIEVSKVSKVSEEGEIIRTVIGIRGVPLPLFK